MKKKQQNPPHLRDSTRVIVNSPYEIFIRWLRHLNKSIKKSEEKKNANRQF